MTYHNPVLLEESVAGLSIKPNGVYVDVTFGGGGHSRKILDQLGDQGKLFAFDQDVDALENTIDDNRFLLIHQNFRHIKRFLKFYGITQVDGILGDFGVSSHQFDVAERGFSTRFDAALDMRMNQESAVSALHIINEYSESDLRRILFQYGDLKSASGMARMLVESRQVSAIATTDDLKKALGRFLPKQKENKILAQVFQAVRIEVNQEIQALKEFLLQTVDLLPKGGRLSLISYHSLEDRLVKRFIRDGKFEGQAEKDVFGNVEVPYKKVGKLIVTSEEETKENNRARSAKLRIAQRL
jgi:16S rRNA (cytosine1402-N4)-methyltransferase